MPKLHKSPPPSYSGLILQDAGLFQPGTKYEDIPISPPYQLPSLGLPQPHQTATPPTPIPSPLTLINSRNDIAQAAQSNLSPFLSATRRADASLNFEQSPAQSRARSAPPNSRRAFDPLTQPGHSESQTPHFMAQESTSGPREASQRHGRTSCPQDCTRCGKQRPESVDATWDRRRHHFLSDDIPAPPAHPVRPRPLRIKACGPNCNKCGKRKTSPNSNAKIEALGKRPNVLREVPQAHIRPLSEGSIQHSSLPAPIMTEPAASHALQPIPGHHYHQCHTCGKPKKPEWMKNLSQHEQPHMPKSTDWPLVPTADGPRQTLPRPMILRGFENNASATTLVSAASPFINNREDSPLIEKRPSEFNTMRQRSSQGSRTRQPLPHRTESVTGGLVRRISNAFRAAEISVVTEEPARRALPTLHLAPPQAGGEGTERIPSPFSFVGAATDDQFEMVALRQMSVSSRSSSSEASNPYAMNQYEDDLHKSVYTAYNPRSGREDTDTEEKQLQKARDQMLLTVPGRKDSVMQRAVSGSLRRFKSLQGAHREFYRTDLDIHSSAAYGYETRQAVDVY